MPHKAAELARVFLGLLSVEVVTRIGKGCDLLSCYLAHERDMNYFLGADGEAFPHLGNKLLQSCPSFRLPAVRKGQVFRQVLSYPAKRFVHPRRRTGGIRRKPELYLAQLGRDSVVILHVDQADATVGPMKRLIRVQQLLSLAPNDRIDFSGIGDAAVG